MEGREATGVTLYTVDAFPADPAFGIIIGPEGCCHMMSN
jgi:hypothetical protein